MIKYLLLFQLWFTTFSNMIQQEILGNKSEYYLVDDEKILLFGGIAAIPSNKSDLQQNFSEYMESHQSQLLFEEHRLSDSFTDILIVESYDEKYFMLCLVQNSINCQYKIHNVLLDDKLVIENQQNIQFTTEFQQCQSIINFKENLYLLIYQQDFTKNVQIFDSQNQVLDSISISIASNYPLQYTFYKDQLLFYEIDTYESTITIYQIEDNNTFNKDPKREKIKANDQKFGKIKYIQKHEDSCLLVTFEYYIEIQYNQETPQVNIVIFSMPQDFLMIGRNQNLIFGINQSSQSSEINFLENFLSFGTESLLPIDAFFVEKRLVVVFQQEIRVYQNRLLYNTIKTSSKKVIQLGALPFFILVTTDVIIYKTQSLPRYIQKDNSKYIFVQEKENPTFTIKYELKSYSLKYPKFFIHDYFNSIELFDNQQAKIQKELLYTGIPINFEACYPQSQNEILQISQTIYQTKFSLNEGLIKLFYHKQYIIALIQINQTLLIQVYDEQKQKLTNLKNSGNISQIQDLYIFQQSNLVLNKGYYLNHYIFDEQQMAFDMIKQIHFSSQIRQIKKVNDKYLFILFKNCTILLYYPLLQQITSSKVSKQGMTFKSDCTSAQYSLGTQFFVNSTFITYFPNLSQKRSNIYSFTEILDCDLINERMVIYELIDQNVIIKLYSIESKDFILLYTLPTYQYKIYFPLQKKILDNSLAILAVYEQQQVILIYKVSNSAAHSLIRVITIDKGQGESFDFIYQQSQLIYYVVNQTVCYQYFNDVELNATFNRDIFINVIQANCSVKSQISNDVFNVKQSFKFINKRFGISFDGENKLNLKMNQNNEKIIQLKHIIGVVDNLKLYDETGNCDIKMPLIFVNNVTHFCQAYSTNYCLNQENQILTDIFGSQRLINLNIQLDKLYTFASVTNDKYYIIFRSHTLNQNLYYQEMDQTKNIEYPPILVPEHKKFKSVKKKVNNLFILEIDDWTNTLEIAFIEENNIQFLKFSDISYLEIADIVFYQNYYLILAGTQLTNIHFYYSQGNSNQEFTTLNSLVSFNIFEAFQRPELNNQFYGIHDISILKTKLTDNNLFVDFALFFNLDYGYVCGLQINLQNQSYSNSIKHFVRYGYDKILINVLFCNENLIILKQKINMENMNIKFYDLDTEKEIIDSYFKTVDSNFTQIGYYNSTHLIFLQQQQEQTNFILAKVGGYLLDCKTKEKNKTLSVILANQVQLSQAYLMLENDQEKQNSFIVMLISVNLGFIILIIQFRRRKTNPGAVQLPIK